MYYFNLCAFQYNGTFTLPDIDTETEPTKSGHRTRWEFILVSVAVQLLKTGSNCEGNGIYFIILVSLLLPSWMDLIPIHDGNGNSKNGYHGDQLACSHCDDNGI